MRNGKPSFLLLDFLVRISVILLLLVLDTSSPRCGARGDRSHATENHALTYNIVRLQIYTFNKDESVSKRYVQNSPLLVNANQISQPFPCNFRALVAGVIFELGLENPVYVETFNGSFSYKHISDLVQSTRSVDDIPFNDFCEFACEGTKLRRSNGEDENGPFIVNNVSFDWNVHWRDGDADVDWIHRVLQSTIPDRTSLKFSVLLSVEYESRSRFHPLITSNDAHVSLSEMLDTCVLRSLSSAEQTTWPLHALVDETGNRFIEWPCTGRGVVTEEIEILIRSDDVDTLSSLHDGKIDDGRQQDFFRRKYPNIYSSWHPAVPPMPNFCGVTEGTVGTKDIRRLREHHEVSFIETFHRSRAGIPGLSEIMDFVVKLILPPIMNPFTNNLAEHYANTGGAEQSHQVNADVPMDVVRKLAPNLRWNLVNLLPDLMAAHLTRSLTTDLTMDVGPGVLSHVSNEITASLHRDIAATLSIAVPDKIASVLPYLLERSLPIALTRQLTRSITHALVPTLAFGLSRREEITACRSCYASGLHCDVCRDAPSSQYYATYYSTYYADYFADYFQEYYANALLDLDRKQHPNGGAKDAKAHNLGYKMSFDAPFAWQRPMSGSGQSPDHTIGGPPRGAGDTHSARESHWTAPMKENGHLPTIKGSIWGPPLRINDERTGRIQPKDKQ